MKFVIGLIVVLSVTCVALFAPYLAPHGPYDQNVRNRLLPPAWMEGGHPDYPLGTDAVGRDVLSRIMWGSRVSLLVAVSTIVLAGSFGVILGMTAGYMGGWWDSVVSNSLNIVLAFPFVLLALALVPVLGPGLFNIILVLALTGWPVFARVVRAKTLQVCGMDYVEAATAIGASRLSLLRRHILPNVQDTIIVVSSLEIARVIIMEAFLSFIGVGVTPPTPTWGGMLGDGRNYIMTHWWLSTFPGIALAITTLGFNMLGDGLRDLLDSRLPGSSSRVDDRE